MLTKLAHRLAQTIKCEVELVKYHAQPTIPVRYFSDVKNWGDLLNIDVIEYMTQKKVIHCAMGHRLHILGIGSVLAAANSKSVVWGSGFISEQQQLQQKPHRICSVRGPLTRVKLLEQGVHCPKVFGDPALLLPEIYPLKPPAKTKYRLGLIPHYEHATHPWITSALNNEGVTLIDIQQSDSPTFIRQLLECDCIASSSLHGLIASDAYHIPNCRLIFNEMRSFKFDDYYAGVGITDYPSIHMDNDSQLSIEELLKTSTVKQLDFDVTKLKDAFPRELFS